MGILNPGEGDRAKPTFFPKNLKFPRTAQREGAHPAGPREVGTWRSRERARVPASPAPRPLAPRSRALARLAGAGAVQLASALGRSSPEPRPRVPASALPTPPAGGGGPAGAGPIARSQSPPVSQKRKEGRARQGPRSAAPAPLQAGRGPRATAGEGGWRGSLACRSCCPGLGKVRLILHAFFRAWSPLRPAPVAA